MIFQWSRGPTQYCSTEAVHEIDSLYIVYLCARVTTGQISLPQYMYIARYWPAWIFNVHSRIIYYLTCGLALVGSYSIILVALYQHSGLQLVVFLFSLQVGYSTQSRQFSGLLTKVNKSLRVEYYNWLVERKTTICRPHCWYTATLRCYPLEPAHRSNIIMTVNIHTGQ